MRLTKYKKAIMAIISVALALLLIGFCYTYTLTPSYNFLQDEDCISIFDRKGSIAYGNSATVYAYSFPEDFNTVCTIARKELVPLGFRETTHVVDANGLRLCSFLLQKPRRGVDIFENQEASIRAIPGRVEHNYREGWNSISVTHVHSMPFIDRIVLSLKWRNLRILYTR